MNAGKNNIKNRIISWGAVLLCTVLAVFLVKSISDAMQSRENQGILSRNEETQIVVLGDSIWDLVRDDTSVTSYLSKELGGTAAIYNCAIKGSRAAVTDRDTLDPLTDEICLYTMAKYIAGEKQIAIPAEYEAASLIREIDFTQVDYVLLAFGLNDYFGAVKQKNPDDCYDPKTYYGALCGSVELIRSAYPEVKFMILSPTYCQGYSYGQVIQESDTYDYGGGTIVDYVNTAQAAAEFTGSAFVNNYEELGISIHNGAQYLEDATHLTQKGRQLYARNLSEHVLEMYEQN